MINPGRTIVSDSLTKVILEVFGRNDISERSIKDAWLEETSSRTNLTYNGWYSPPENGMAILASHGDDMERTHFRSFRDPQFFASRDPIDWSSSTITAYASNVDSVSGLPADFATTIYFGDRKDVKEHVQQSFAACQELLSELKEVTSGKELYIRMEDILAQRRIDGRTWSTTDNDYNFGHTLPLLATVHGLASRSEKPQQKIVTSAGAEEMRTHREFLSSESELDLLSGIQFTVEPQCVSQHTENLPKVMIHYVVQHRNGIFQVCDVCEDLPSRYGLH